ncbi:DUF4124 domain-containing protein [Pseudomonadota bacterium]
MTRLASGFLTSGVLCGIILISPGTHADDIYKIVDEDGNVTYSSSPPGQGEASEVIEPPPAPPTEDVEAALKRQEKIEEKFDKLDQTRAEQIRQAALQRPNNTTTVIQSNTVLGGGTPWLYGPYWRGAAVAPGAPTAPGYRPPYDRPPHYRPPGYRPRPPIAAPHWRAGP